MHSNLPPGVTTGMIPGNRPIDRWWEYCEERVDQMTVAEFQDRLRNARAEQMEALRLFLIEELVDEIPEGPDRDEDY